MTERRGALFKEVYYKTKEMRQPTDVNEVQDMIHEVSWALQTMTNRSGYSPAQRVFGKQPSVTMELTNDSGMFDRTHSMTADQAWQRSEEIRQAARKALLDLDSKEKLQRAIRARPRRAREDLNFNEGDPVWVWRQGRRGSQAKVGPCYVILQKGDSVWVSRRNELWKCNRLQVSHMGNVEKQGLEMIPLQLLRAKEQLRFHRRNLPYVDVEGEGPPPDGAPEREPEVQRRAPPTPRPPATPRPAGTPRTPVPLRVPPEGSKTLNPSTPARASGTTTPAIVPVPATPVHERKETTRSRSPAPKTLAKTTNIEIEDAEQNGLGKTTSKPMTSPSTPRPETVTAEQSSTTTSRSSQPATPASRPTSTPVNDGDELWRATLENQRSEVPSTSSGSKPPAAEEELHQWNRVDLEARRFRGSNSKGPLWGDVVRRLTLDLDKGKMIADEIVTPEMGVHKLHRQLAEGVKTSRQPSSTRRLQDTLILASHYWLSLKTNHQVLYLNLNFLKRIAASLKAA